MTENISPRENSNLEKFLLINHLSEFFTLHNSSSVGGVENDSAIIKPGKETIVTSSLLFIENIHFDLTYFPLKHLGYKIVAVTAANIVAMNAKPTQIALQFAISNRFSLEAMEELMTGVKFCCERYNIDLVGLDITSSITGLTVSTYVVGEVSTSLVVTQKGAKPNDLICVSGDLGSAYTGLIILEREKKVFAVNPDMQPDFAGYDYLLERQLKPELRLDVIEDLAKLQIIPTAMINLRDGLAGGLIRICNASTTGCSIFEEKLPIDTLTFDTLKALNIVATTIALSGGEDYELLFTITQKDYEQIKKLQNISIIGYMTAPEAGKNLITNDNKQIELKAQGF